MPRPACRGDRVELAGDHEPFELGSKADKVDITGSERRRELLGRIGQLAACYRAVEIGLRGESEDIPLIVATTIRSIFLRPILPNDHLTLVGGFIGQHTGLYERFIGQVLRGDPQEICTVVWIEGCYAE